MKTIKIILLTIISLSFLNCTRKFQAKQYNIIKENNEFICRWRFWEAGPNYIGPTNSEVFRVPMDECLIIGFQVEDYVRLVNWAEELRIRTQTKKLLNNEDITQDDEWTKIILH